MVVTILSVSGDPDTPEVVNVYGHTGVPRESGSTHTGRTTMSCPGRGVVREARGRHRGSGEGWSGIGTVDG